MRSIDVRRLLGLVLVTAALTEPLAARQESAAVSAHSAADIARALEAVKKDPNLGGERMFRMLRWREAGQKPARSNLAWLSWIRDLFRWIMQSGRYLMWAALVFLAAWLAVYIARAIRGRERTEADEPFVAPTHVRSLDIRPESLPANIGQAARNLWDRGEHRAALSLLYRGLLSRLTHVHRVPITDSSTEGDCLSLMAGRVPARTSDYSTRLVAVWLNVVYGGAAQPADVLYGLCDEFSAALDRRSAPATGAAR